MKLSLLHQGLILVSIPLCFEIVIFSCLINAQNHLEFEAQKINRNKKINDKVNVIFEDLFGILDSLRSKKINAEAPTLTPKRAMVFIADLPKRFDELGALSQGEPEMLQNIQEGKRQVNLALSELAGMRAKLRSADSSDFAQIMHDTSSSAESHFQNLMNLGIFDWANKNEIEREFLRKEMWEQNRIVLKCGLAVSVLLGIALSFWLSKRLVRRVSLLSENAVLMGQGKPLLPAQGGTDELAELDRNFHQAADLLEAAKRMRQEVTAMITHDLRTPLQAVLFFLEMLGRGRYGEINAAGKRLLPISFDSCSHMARLIENVLQLEKLRSGALKLKTARIELSSFLEECIASVQLLAEEKSVALKLSGKSETTRFVEVDQFWLEQVVVNILANAVKFCPAGSSINIAVLDKGNMSTIRISDQGPGIPADEQQHIFDRFHRGQSSASVPGTGLGLPIAKELIELHGGSISVESAEGEGATFVLVLPVNKMAPEVTVSQADREKSHENADAATETAPAPALARKPAFKLIHKGLILICIPLLFEVTIFSVLFNLQDQVEQEANRIDHNRQVNDAANSVLRDLAQAAFALRQVKRKDEQSQVSENQLRLLYGKVQQDFQKLKALVDNEDMKYQVSRGEHGVQLLAGKLTTQSQSIALREQLISELLSLIGYLAKRSAMPEYDLRGSEFRAESRQLLYIALIFSVMISWLGAIGYSRLIVVRLRKLGQDASLLAKGEPLLPLVKGSDEIAVLDASFHEAAAQIEAAKRMRQEATAMITHDLKTPLQSLRSFLEMLEHGNLGEINEAGKKGQSSSRSAVKRMEELINSVLQLEALRSGHLKLQTNPIAVASVLDKCLGSIKALADRKNIALTRNYDGLEVERVKGDDFWLEQVFVNILSNAVKFSPADSAVSVTLRKGAKQIEVSITDQGMGIPPEQLNLVFERFHRVDAAALIPGTGLGLPIAKELIELHHGSISVESSVGKGSTFTVALPSADAP